MKLFSLRLTTLKSKLYAIVFASFVVRVVAFFILPSSPSSLGPDEGTYGRAANWTALGKPATEFPDFGAGLYVSGRSLLLPAAFFNKIGFTQLNAVRLTASIYGLLLVCLVVSIALKIAAKNPKFVQFTEKSPRIFFGLFSIFVFIPSHFVWSILGLRESATEFWVISAFGSLFLILQLRERISLLSSCAFITSIIMVFSARPQVGWVLGVTLLLYLLFKIRNRIARILIPVTTLGILLGYASTVASTLESNPSYIAKSEFSTPTSSPSTSAEDKASNLCNSQGQVIELYGKNYRCESIVSKKATIKLKNPAEVIIDKADSIPYHHEVGKVNASSEIETIACPKQGVSRFDKYFCIAYRAPYTTFTFLFRPLLGLDITSPMSLFAAIENIFWISAVFYVMIMFICNRRLAFFGALGPSLLFMLIYSVAAGAYEGNIGTAFRHKSLILWVVILLLVSTIVATQERKNEKRRLD